MTLYEFVAEAVSRHCPPTRASDTVTATLPCASRKSRVLVDFPSTSEKAPPENTPRVAVRT